MEPRMVETGSKAGLSSAESLTTLYFCAQNQVISRSEHVIAHKEARPRR